MAGGSKRRRRVLIVVGAVVLAGLGAFGVREYRRHLADVKALAGREAGHAAYARGDFPVAVTELHRYLRRFGDEGAAAEDFLALARARLRVPAPRDAHVFEAIGVLRRCESVAPGNEDVRRELLDLYVATRHATEALDVLDRLLEAHPQEVGLHEKRREILLALGRHELALEAALTVNRLAPRELTGHLRTLTVLLAMDRPKSEVTAWLDRVSAEHPGDRRFEILRVAAFRRLDDWSRSSEALTAILSAAGELPKDPDFTLLLAAELDAAQRYADAIRVLEGVSGSQDPRIRTELARRLWFAGRRGDLGRLVSEWDRGGLGEEPELLALAVVAEPEGAAAASRAARRERLAASDDPRWKAWKAFVDALDPRPDDPRPPGERLRDLTAAVGAVPGSALLHHALGEAYAATGEVDLAMASWRDASTRAPSWAAPLRRTAEACLAANNVRLAALLAKSAVQRNPRDVASVATYLRALSELGTAGEDALRPILDAVARIRAEDAEAGDSMLSLEVELLFRTDAASAERRLRDFIASGRRAREETLLQVARQAGRHGSPLEKDLLDLCEAAHGISPRLGLARADAARRGAGTDAGLAALEAARRSAAGTSPPVEWDIARAVYLEATGSARAAETWRALADAHPGELRAQLGALASPAIWRDRPVVAEIVERVRVLGGEQGVTWRLARARLVLGAPDSDSAQIAEIGQMMADVVRVAPASAGARMLFAQALHALGNVKGAEEQYAIAAQLAPEDTSVTLELARILQAQGKTELARAQLERAMSAPDLPPEQRERAAFLLALDGQVRRGVEVLEPLVSEAGGSRRDAVLLLARLYVRLGERSRALALAEPLLASPDAEVVEFCARLHAATGRADQAEAVLAHLERLSLAPGDRELVRARVAASSGDPPGAAGWFARAVAAAPAREDAWISWLSHLVVSADRRGFEAALDSRDAAADPTAAFLSARRSECVEGLSDDRFRILLVQCIEDPRNREVLWSAAVRVLDLRGPAQGAAEAARALAVLADGHPDQVGLQVVAADALSVSGNLKGGVEIALRATGRFPNSALAASVAARLLARAGRWSEVLVAARQWRDRSPASVAAAESLVAEALLRTGKFADAVVELGPSARAAVARPGERLPVVGAFALSLLRSGDLAGGRAFLREAAAAGAEVRIALLGVASDRFGDAATANEWISCLREPGDPASAEETLAAARALTAAWDRFRTPDLLAAATALVERTLGALPGDPRAHTVAGILAQQRGELADARAKYEAALSLDAADLLARNNLAVVLADLGLAREAVEQATRVASAAPGSAEIQDTLAHAHRAAGDLDRAVACLREAVRLDPPNPAWHVALAETLVRAGRSGEVGLVLAALDEVVSASGPLPEAMRVRVAAVRAKIR